MIHSTAPTTTASDHAELTGVLNALKLASMSCCRCLFAAISDRRMWLRLLPNL